MASTRDLPQLKCGTAPVGIEVVGEPEVVFTARGYAPVVRARTIKTGLEYLLYISAKSLAESLEPLRVANGGTFRGLRFSIRKESSDAMARYVVEGVPPTLK